MKKIYSFFDEPFEKKLSNEQQEEGWLSVRRRYSDMSFNDFVDIVKKNGEYQSCHLPPWNDIPKDKLAVAIFESSSLGSTRSCFEILESRYASTYLERRKSKDVTSLTYYYVPKAVMINSAPPPK